MNADFLNRRIKIDEKILSKMDWTSGEIIAYHAKEYGLGDIIYAENLENWHKYKEGLTSIAAAINFLNTQEIFSGSFTDYCFEHNIPIVYPFDMGWGAAIIVSDNHSPIKIAKRTKTGNYNDDIRAYIGRYVSFWSHQTPTSLLLNNNPVLSNTLMLQNCLYVLILMAAGKAIKLFPDMYYCLCNPGRRI